MIRAHSWEASQTARVLSTNITQKLHTTRLSQFGQSFPWQPKRADMVSDGHLLPNCRPYCPLAAENEEISLFHQPSCQLGLARFASFFFKGAHY